MWHYHESRFEDANYISEVSVCYELQISRMPRFLIVTMCIDIAAHTGFIAFSQRESRRLGGRSIEALRQSGSGIRGLSSECGIATRCHFGSESECTTGAVGGKSRLRLLLDALLPSFHGMTASSCIFRLNLLRSRTHDQLCKRYIFSVRSISFV